MAASSIASELFEVINKIPFKSTFTHLREDNVVSSNVIKSLKRTVVVTETMTRVISKIEEALYCLMVCTHYLQSMQAKHAMKYLTL